MPGLYGPQFSYSTKKVTVFKLLKIKQINLKYLAYSKHSTTFCLSDFSKFSAHKDGVINNTGD